MPKKPTRKPFYSQEYESWAIPLTQGVIALIDFDKIELIGQWDWHARRQARHWYAARKVRRPDGSYTALYMHRVVVGEPDNMEVDHIEHHAIPSLLIDNRRSNLRICSHAENGRNRLGQHGCSSDFKGVVWHKRIGRWGVQIRTSGRRKSLGYFDCEIEAARAYDVAAKELHGDYALLNFTDNASC